MAAIYTIRHSGYDLAPAGLIMATAAISFGVILGLRESSRTTLEGDRRVGAGRVGGRGEG
jgi:hypothetical protein